MATEAQTPEVPTVAPVGKVRSPIVVIVLILVTLGIYYAFWLYHLYQEQAEHNGEGLRGAAGVLIGVFAFPVNWFLLPATIGQTFDRGGQDRACSAETGFWNLVPLIGPIVWLFRVQDSMNHYWQTRI